MTRLQRTSVALRAIAQHRSWPWIQIVGTMTVGAALAMRWVGKAAGTDFYVTIGAGLFLMRPDKLIALAKVKYGKDAP